LVFGKDVFNVLLRQDVLFDPINAKWEEKENGYTKKVCERIYKEDNTGQVVELHI
jgi:hypothetical protein